MSLNPVKNLIKNTTGLGDPAQFVSTAAAPAPPPETTDPAVVEARRRTQLRAKSNDFGPGGRRGLLSPPSLIRKTLMGF